MLVLPRIFVLLLLWAFPAQAAVIETTEWESKPGVPWSYSGGQSGNGAAIDASPCHGVASPSGGSALRMLYPAGTYSTSTSGGTAARTVSPPLQELYFGHWGCYSNNFVWNNNGTKMDFFILSQADPANGQTYNLACGFGPPAANLGCSNQISWDGFTVSHPCNLGTCTNTRGTWDWYLWRVKVNTPGQSNGEADLWINDVHKLHYTNIPLLNSGQSASAGFGSLQHAGTWGGGGGKIPLMYWWIDHTVLSTTFISRPGGTPTQDTSPPAIPTVTPSVISGTAVSLTLSNPSDNVAVTGRTILWCSIPACTPAASLTTLSGSATSFQDTTVSPGVTYRYLVRDNDAAGNQATSTTVQEVTTTALFRQTLGTDTFVRADNTNLGASWDAGYTAQTNAQIVSNRVRGVTVNTRSFETYNAITPANDQWAQGTVGAFTGAQLADQGVHMRASNAATMTSYGCFIVRNGSNTMEIREYTAGTPVVLAGNSTYTPLPGDQYRCDVQGTALRMYLIRGATTFLAVTATDATIASGKVALSNFVFTGGALTNNESGSFSFGDFGTSASSITVDGVSSSATGNTTNTISWNHPVGTGNNRLFVGCAQARDTVAGDTAVTAYTYAGLPLTKIRHDAQTGTFRTELWYLANPPSGTNTATITWEGALASYGVGSGLSLGGVDLASPLDAQAGGTGSGTTASAAITTVANNAMIVDCALLQDLNLTVGAGQMQQVNRATTGSVDQTGMSTAAKAVAGAETMDWTQTGAENWAMSAASFKPGVTVPVVPPTIASFTLDATGADVVHGPTTSTFIRVRTFTSQRTISSIEHPIADFPGGRFSQPWLNGLQGVCMDPMNELREVTVGESKCASLQSPVAIVGPLDDQPPIMSNPLPSGTLPADTTSTTTSLTLNKPGVSCRQHTSDVSYAAMAPPTGVDMETSGLTASTAVAGLTNGSNTTLYRQCNFQDINEIDHPTTTSQPITIAVAAAPGGDTTLPSAVSSVTLTTLGATSLSVLFPAATDNVAVGKYEVRLSTDTGVTYSLAATLNHPTVATNLVGLLPNTTYQASVRSYDTSLNQSATDTVSAPVTTPALLDTERPSNMTNLHVIDPGFTSAVILGWNQGTDNNGSVYTTIEISANCSGAFTQALTNIALSLTPINLTPGTLHCARGFHTDEAGNRSADYSNEVQFTTASGGLSIPRAEKPFGVDNGTVIRNIVPGMRALKP